MLTNHAVKICPSYQTAHCLCAYVHTYITSITWMRCYDMTTCKFSMHIVHSPQQPCKHGMIILYCCNTAGRLTPTQPTVHTCGMRGWFHYVRSVVYTECAHTAPHAHASYAGLPHHHACKTPMIS